MRLEASHLQKIINISSHNRNSKRYSSVLPLGFKCGIQNFCCYEPENITALYTAIILSLYSGKCFELIHTDQNIVAINSLQNR